ncbi:unnamed protein product [Medioppia subpectinata]|uniref:SKI-interacting protein SKIP SNW domain-containing protein n=1 Tax=Medioppia subpectinata TaxID=1979941 RepID=A0A7R9KRP9_9ACAR|nr:unnamed protein product [Medioppia subpectinata]CAG2108584.1 unnamed protein product [Medioppia subpectinata]
MTSFASRLPSPKRSTVPAVDDVIAAPVTTLAASRAPEYGFRIGWTPRCDDDFGDGGAFPEILVAQFPRGIGRQSAVTSNALAVELDAKGNIRFDALLKQNANREKVIYHRLQDLLPEEVLDEDTLQKPDEEAVQSATEETRLALQRITQSKIAAALPVRAAEKTAPAQYIRYTASQSDPTCNSGSDQRIIRMVEVQKDPLEPPRFKMNKKVPQAPPSPPPPVMHSPTRKVSVREQQEWRIPPCISNWKNSKGYTIPLDKRLAADGRGLQQIHINENFAKLSEALYVADRKAREAVETRAQMERKLAQKEKERKEDHLRSLAAKAREERAGIRDASPVEDARERDQIRHDRHRERQRERNVQRAAPEKRSRLERQRERDISEQIALGVANARSSGTDVQFDERLFNQSKGLGSGFQDDDEYGVYDKPWRSAAAVQNNLYRPSRAQHDETYDLEALAKTSRFAPDKEFAGTDHSTRREGPMERKLAQKEKERKEDHLRSLAAKAREERAGIRDASPVEDARERDQIRHDRHRERQRERNVQRAAPEKRSRLERQRERDISEQIALGVANARSSGTDVQFDERLFNQSKGLGSGFQDDDEYGVYDKPWRSAAAVQNNLYRPSRAQHDETYDLEALAKTSRFAPDKEFAGTDHSTRREGPVQFERQEEEDPFGLDKFLTEVKKSSKRSENSETKSSSKRRKD